MSQFKSQLLMHFQEEGVSYKDTRKGNNGKQTTDGLEPKVNDFVTYKSGAKIRFGRISKINHSGDPNIVVFVKRNKDKVNAHVWTIRCIYREFDQDNYANINIET